MKKELMIQIMNKDRGYWMFYGVAYENYSAIRKDLGILIENLASSKILIPTVLNANIPLKYKTTEDILDQIDASGCLGKLPEIYLGGDTVIYTPNGEEVHKDIVRINSFRTATQSFFLILKTDHWLPMMIDEETDDFSWNLEQYQLNYFRIPALLKKLHNELGWENKDLFSVDEDFITIEAGYDFFIKESIIKREYLVDPNPDFDLDAYLAAIKHARENNK